MPFNRIQEHLDSQRVRYVVIKHSKAYTAQEVAASAHIPGEELAKTVMVSFDGKLGMAVLPATRNIDFAALKSVAGTQTADLAVEKDFRDTFPDCETGAMPPFGNLYGMNVYVDDTLAEDEEIAFNACSHTELLRMTFSDFKDLVHPTVGHFST